MKTITEEMIEEKAISIPKSHPEFVNLKWLAKAISRDKTRHPLQFIRVEIGLDCRDDEPEDFAILVATCGRRMHKLETSRIDGLETGGYSMRLTASEIMLIPEDSETTGRFPTWRQVLPRWEGKKWFGVELRASVESTIGITTARLNEACRERGMIAYNDGFLSEALGKGTLYGVRGYRDWKARTMLHDALELTSGELTAVVMPLRVKENSAF